MQSPEIPPTAVRGARLPMAVLVLLAGLPLLAFVVNPFQPLLEHHSFRQTQTALTSYWLMHGGGLFPYLTPVLGFPWTVPMEFPIFQAIVAIAAGATGMPLDFTGRLLGLAFFYLTIVPMVLVLRRYGRASVGFAIALYVTSPIGLFFSRAFLIESLATLLALSALCCYIRYLREPRGVALLLFAVLGSLAGLQKITTFLPVAAVCSADIAWRQWGRLRRGGIREVAVLPAAAIAASLVLPGVWTLYADAIKRGALLSNLMTSSSLREWNFGTLSMRLHAVYWLKVFGGKIALMGGFAVACVIFALALRRKRVLANGEAWMFGGAGLLGPLIFANLHFVHDYYLMSSLVFLACGFAIAVSPYLDQLGAFSARPLLAGLACIVAVNLALFGVRYWPMLRAVPAIDAEAYDIARDLRDREPGDDVTLIVGMDWNGTVPYYSQRYALMIPDALPARERAQVLANPRAYTNGRRIGAVVYCPSADRDAVQEGFERAALLGSIEGELTQLPLCTLKIRRADSAARPTKSPPAAAPHGAS